MDRHWIKAFDVFYIGLACLLMNCGSADTNEDNENYPNNDPGMSPGQNTRGSGLAPVFDNKKTKNPSAGYVTEIVAETGCADHDDEFTVAKNHEDFGRCERIMLTAMDHDTSLDGNEINFLWFIADPGVAELDCPVENNNELCRPKGKIDIFDADGGYEPQTTVMACALNSCPDPKPEDCSNLVCTDMSLTSVFNLEGGWMIHGDTLEEDLVMIPYQDGRRFVDDDIFIHGGSINGLAIRFEMVDYIYIGEILSQDYIQGTILDSTDMSVVGQWFAERLS